LSRAEATTRRPFWTGPRIVAAGVLVALALIALRFGPRLLPRGRTTGESPGAAAPSGSFRPLGFVEDGLARLLASRLVEAPPPGEAVAPKIRYERPWPEWLALLVLVGGAALVIGLYRREGAAPGWAKGVLAGLRIGVIALAMLVLSEAVLTVERTGLPTFAILVDDSASAQIADPYAETKAQEEAAALARASGREKPDRLALALGWLARDDARLLRTLAEQQKVKLYRVSEGLVPLAEVNKPEEVPKALAALKTLEPKGEQSRLGDGVRGVLTELRGTPPTAILLLSDGRTTDGARLTEAAEEARKAGVPLFTVGLGDESPARDLALSDLQVDEVAFVGDAVRFQARLLARGLEQPGATATVELKRRRPGSGNAGDLESVATERVPIPPDGQPRRVELVHTPTEVGPTAYVVEVRPVERELQRDNNRLERTIDVRDQKLRVLYVEGEPRWEFRYLKTYLERDSTIELGIVLQSSDDRYAEQDRSALPAFPPGNDGPDGLFRYDVVILGDIDPSFLNAQQMRDLVEFVTKRGGGLMLVAGELFNPLDLKGTPLEPHLPIRLDDARNPTANGAPVEPFQLTLTPEGRGSPIARLGDDDAASRAIWENLPPLMWYFEAPQTQPTAVVLAEHPSKAGARGRLPLLVYHYAGAGKVLFSAVDDTWRWRLRVGDRFFGRYWVQTLRFLARSKLLGAKQAEVVTDRRRYPRGEVVQVQVRFLNPGLAQGLKSVNVELRGGNQRPRRLTLRPAPGSTSATLFEGSVPNLTEGTYTAVYLPDAAAPGGGEPPSTSFQVDPPAGEFAKIEMDREALTAAARLSGGQFFRWDETAKPIESAGRDTLPGAAAPDSPRGQAAGKSGSAPTGAAPARARTLLDVLPAPQKVPLDTDPPVPLWNTWPVFVLFLTLIGAEWILRKRMQMA
jgi:hypothetical protein